MSEEHEGRQYSQAVRSSNEGALGGLFETLRVHAGRAIEVELHQERLDRSFRACFAREAPRLGPIVRGLLTEAPHEECLLRLDFPSEHEVSWSHGWRPRQAPPHPFVVALARIPRTGSTADRAHKSRDRAWVEECRRDDADETLVWTEQDGVLEGLRSNLFVWDGRRLKTPPVAAGLVPGVVRERVLRVAPGQGVEVAEGPISRDDIQRAEVLFLTGSGLGFLPAVWSKDPVRDLAQNQTRRELWQAVNQGLEPWRGRADGDRIEH